MKTKENFIVNHFLLDDTIWFFISIIFYMIFILFTPIFRTYNKWLVLISIFVILFIYFIVMPFIKYPYLRVWGYSSITLDVDKTPLSYSIISIIGLFILYFTANGNYPPNLSQPLWYALGIVLILEGIIGFATRKFRAQIRDKEILRR